MLGDFFTAVLQFDEASERWGHNRWSILFTRLAFLSSNAAILKALAASALLDPPNFIHNPPVDSRTPHGPQVAVSHWIEARGEFSAFVARILFDPRP
ncbi:hypothetical protein ElyMa_000477000 [Elysia marginata]|uniref:Uncharacterized protein n=1 Tax=Elysia marginata TaxID=1093978 RepID=A0AAV4FU28_9GAST|nr:hypothetical protein ElyMa_000477000 [Elysia marginata]